MEDIVPAISIGTILGAPYLSSFQLVDNLFVRLALLFFVAYAIRQDALSGCLALLASFTLLIERNHEVLAKFPNQAPRWPTTGVGVPIQAPPLTPNTQDMEPPHTESEGPLALHREGVKVTEEHDGREVEKEYEHANDLHDNNPRLKEAPLTDDAPSFYESKGLA